MRDDRCECGECTGADAKEEVVRLRAQVESLSRERDALLDKKPQRDRLFDAEAWDAAMDALGRVTAERDELQTKVERLHAAALLVLRWEGDVPPHGGLGSDMAFLRAELGGAGGEAPRPAPSAFHDGCKNTSPPWFKGRWRDWHRGHGCNLDDGRPRSPWGAEEIANGPGTGGTP